MIDQLDSTLEIVNRYRELPRMARIHQSFPCETLADVPAAVLEQLERACVASQVRPGMKIAITCGSRGIDNIASIIKTVVGFVRGRGAEPFIVPAMGSHGGATAQGQLEVVHSLGVTEAYCGCPIRSSMQTKIVATAPTGEPVNMDRFAAEADGTILVGRIHGHGDVRGGPYESGMMKMITIGLGKQKGAERCHQMGPKFMCKRIPMFAECVLENANILFGVAILENELNRTMLIRSLTKEEIRCEEPKLLAESLKHVPNILPIPADILIVDEIGKNIGGANRYEFVKNIVLDLSEQSEGNALGMGTYDITTRRLFDKIDYDKTYSNTITSTLLFYARLPIVMPNDRMAMQLAVMTCNRADKREARVVRIKNTMRLEDVEVSEAMLAELRGLPNIEVVEEARPIPFNAQGNLF